MERGGVVSREMRVGVLASGRGSNFEALWNASEAGELGARIVCLASDNPESVALQRARDFGLPTCCVESSKRRGRLPREAESEIVTFLRSHAVDLVCLAGFMRIIGEALLEAFPGAILNIHPSLLPSFPGLDAQRQALEHGAKVSGCTVHLVDAGVDSGPIVLQAVVPVRDDDTAATLAARILEHEHEIYPRAVRLWAAGRLRVEGRRVLGADRETSRSRHIQEAKP
ncbi:MAG: phosphoribosylglycinamide formyltransferase [Candidatus Latescibacterota bacterium]|nr:MAG: phosphoribosylglycinamide formyltransferase [Candidatus Latescibacterota bacterium]